MPRKAYSGRPVTAVLSMLPESSPDSTLTLGSDGDNDVNEQQIAADVRQTYATINHVFLVIAKRSQEIIILIYD